MWSATGWDDGRPLARDNGWTVLGRVRQRQQDLRLPSLPERGASELWHDVVATTLFGGVEAQAIARWPGGSGVIALMFAHPGEAVIKTLDERGDYFDIRTGTAWDLFFPGYFEGSEADLEQLVTSKRVGSQDVAHWRFDPVGFDSIRQTVEDGTDGLWSYSGSSEIVLVNVYIGDDKEPIVDWASVQSGALTSDGAGSLGWVVERITRDLSMGYEDPAYGIGAVTQTAPGDGGAGRRLMRDAVLGITTSLAAKALGV